jgi:formylmethanofuran dehydrogenase subunit E-like metal-binding protein
LLGETKSYDQFDFTSQLASGDSVASVTSVVASVYSGVDPTPNVIVKSSSVTGNVVTAVIQAGVLGVMYELLVTVGTTLGNTLQLSAILAVIPDLP